MSMSPRLLRPRESGFTPKNISGLELWLDGADGASLFDATSGGSAVAADGDVARWEDKSGNARHFTQGTANNRPTWRATGRNGRGVLEFNGSSDRLVGDSTQYIQSTRGFTVALVNVVDTTAGSFPALFGSPTNSVNGQCFRFINAASAQASYRDYGMGSQDSSTFPRVRFTTQNRGTWYSLVFRYSGSGALTESNYSMSANKTEQTRASAGLYGSDTGNASIGSHCDGNFLFKGNIGEIIIYSKSLSATEMSSLESYLATKWGT